MIKRERVASPQNDEDDDDRHAWGESLSQTRPHVTLIAQTRQTGIELSSFFHSVCPSKSNPYFVE